MNRAQRRAAMRAQNDRSKQLAAEYTRQKTIESLLQNGITPKHLDAEYERGRQDGFDEAGVELIKTLYAAVCLVLQDEFGFSKEQCWEAVHAVDRKIVWAVDHVELMHEAWEKTGITFHFDDEFDRIGRAE